MTRFHGVIVLCALTSGLPLALFALNVRDFGAVGDGVHDDTLALQRAADAVYPGGRVQDRDIADMRTRFVTDAKNIEHGPLEEVYFPKGVYRLTGPVMFSGPVVLRGEKGAVIRNVSSAEDTFYLHRALYARVSGLAFEGGRIQIRVWNRNCAGPLVVDDCSFSRASGVGFKLDSLAWIDPPKGVNKYDCPPYVVTRTDDGRVRLADRDRANVKDSYSSPLLVIDRCRFADNACALDITSDGEIVRDCLVKVPRTASGAAIRTGSKTLLQNVKVFVCRNPELEQYAFDAKALLTTFQDCDVRSDGDLTAIVSEGRGFSSTIFTRLAIRNLKLDTGVAPVIRFREGTFPNVVSVRGLATVRRPTAAKPILSFERTPDAEEVEGWQKAFRQRSGLQARMLTTDRCWGLALDGYDPKEFESGVPASLEPFVQKIPEGVYVADRERFTSWKEDEWGRTFSDDGIGSRHCSRPNQDDAAKVVALFRRADGGREDGACTVELPPRWIFVKDPIELVGKVRVVSRGIAVLTGDDAHPIFRVGEGADVLFENIHFRGGKNVLEANVANGRARFYNCEFFDQAETCLKSVCPAGRPNMRIEVTAGDATCHSTYVGNANPMLFDCTEFNPGIDHPRNGPERRTYCNIVNRPGGRLVFRETLSSPMCFEYVWPKRRMEEPASPEQMGDYRWLDNYGRFESYGARFGGEWGGLTPVYQYGSDATTYVEGGYCQVSGSRLNPGRAQIRTDGSEVRAAFVEVGCGNFRNNPCVFAWRGEMDTADRKADCREFLSWPLSSQK